MADAALMLDTPRILYHDNHCLVVIKPWNMLVQADATGDPSLLEWAKEWVRSTYGKPGRAYLGLVHRIDRPAAGIVLFARTTKAASRLSAQFREKTVRKRYLAVVHGQPGQPRQLCHDLMKDEASVRVRVVAEGEGKRAILRILSVIPRGDVSLVEVDLLTGRPHQIRVQCSAIGCPIVGDLKYGAPAPLPGRNIALFACGLEFVHPTLREPMRFAFSPPVDEPPWNRFPINALDGLGASIAT